MNLDPRVSVRTRLALWNVVILVAILAIFSVGLHFTVEKVLTDQLDKSMTDLLRPVIRAHEGLAPDRKDRDLGAPQRPDGNGPEFRRGMPSDEGPPPGAEGPPEGPGDPAGRPRFIPRMKMPPGIYVPRIYPQQRDQSPYAPTGLQVIRPGGQDFRYETFEGETVRVLTLPIVRDGQIVGAGQIASQLTNVRRAVNGVTTATFYLIPMVLLLAGGGAVALTSSALRPVRDLTAAASDIGATNLSERLPQQGQDEFAQLAGVLNQMLTRIESAFARQKRFTADASHELRTPLAVIKAHTSMLLDDDTATVAELKDALQTIDSASDRAQRIVQDLLLLARGEAGTLSVQWAPVSLNQVLEDAVRAVQTTRKTPGAGIQLIVPPETRLVSDRDHLTRLFINFLDNALRHTPVSGQVTVLITVDNRQVTAMVTDTGEGMAAEHLERIVEPFYRVDAARARKSGGAGLGLAICRTIIETLGGTMRFQSALGKGTTVTVVLPISPASGGGMV